MVLSVVGEYQLLPFILHGNHSGAFDDRVFHGDMPDKDRRMETGGYGRRKLPSVGVSGNCVYLFLTEDENERIDGADYCFLE